MRNIKDFQARYDRWKNGERYWDIRGIDLPRYDTGDKTTMKKKNNFYSWLDLIANKKAQEWTQAPMKPLSTDEVYADMLNDPTYNYKTFYDLQPYMAERMLTADPNAHFTDIGKTMYHPTFSNESIYSGKISDYNPYGIVGGSWNEAGTEYTPSMSLLANYWNYNRTRDYLDHAEDHPVKINLPEYDKANKETDDKTLDQKAQEEREYLAKHPFLANTSKNLKEISRGWDNFWENNLFRYPAMVVSSGIFGKGIQKLGRMKKAADLIKLRKDTAHLDPPFRDTVRDLGLDLPDRLASDILEAYGKFQQTPIGALLPFNYGKEGNSVKINLPEYYTGKGGPSRSIRKYIASAEGSHFDGLNRRWGGDAVGTFYKRLGNIIGNDTWNALTQNQRDALTSYYYNIKPSSFNPTLNAIRQWAANGMKHDDLSAIRDTINVGMNNKKLSGLRKRRLYELDLFMKDIQPTGIINGNIVQQIPSNNIQIPMDPNYNISTVHVPISQDIRTVLNPYINIPLKPMLYPDKKPDGSFDCGKSGIYINPANRGKFNATKKRTGKTTEELSHSKNPLTRKRALFALNARKWKH